MFKFKPSLIIFTFQFFDKALFFCLIYFSIKNLSEKKFFVLYSWKFSCPFPATIRTSPDFKSFIAFSIAISLDGISKTLLNLIPFLICDLIFLDFLILDCHLLSKFYYIIYQQFYPLLIFLVYLYFHHIQIKLIFC